MTYSVTETWTLQKLSSRELLILAVDPGKSGSAVLLDSAGTPVERETNFQSTPDLGRRVFQLAKRASAGVIELVGAKPGEGVVSMFHFGESYGAAQGAMAAAGLSTAYIAPQRWQNYIRMQIGIPRVRGEVAEEFDSRLICQSFFGEDHDWYKRKKDHNTADAVLLGLYWLWASAACETQSDLRKIVSA